MRSILLAMTEDEHDHRSWRGAGLVGVFVLLTLALNACTREQAALVREVYAHDDNFIIIFIAAVTAAQILAAAAVITAETPRGDLPNKEALVILLFSHGGMTFLHDYLLSLGSSHLSLSAAFSQPFMSLLTLWIVTAVAARPATWLSSIVIGLGCAFVCVQPAVVFSSDRTSLICALVAFTMVLRNIVMRQLVNLENVSVRFRSSSTISALTIAAMASLVVIYLFTSPVWIAPMLNVLTTCVVSASLVFVTAQLLRIYNVTFLSLFYVWALLVEALVFTPLTQRPDVLLLCVGLTFLVLGHYMFFKDYVENEVSPNTGLITYTSKPVNTHEQYTRIEFLLFSSLVMGVIFYVFQPRVSQRDLNTLSYVGLDRVIRRLLTIKEEGPAVHEHEEKAVPGETGVLL